MKQGIVLLSADGYYLSDRGELPVRPSWDKSFITEIIRDKLVLCSYETMMTLPPSLLAIANFTTNTKAMYDINFGIDTFKTSRPQQLLVVRSKEPLGNGKKFDLRGWKNIYKSKDLEIYV